MEGNRPGVARPLKLDFWAEDYARVATLLRMGEEVRRAAASNNHNVILSALDRMARFADRLEADHEDGDSYFRAYVWEEGRVLSADDVRDLQKVLFDYNEEMGTQAELYHAAREQVLREIGGDELIEAAATADAARAKRAFAHYQALAAKYEAEAAEAPHD